MGGGTWGTVGVRSLEEACSGRSEGTSVLRREAQGSGKWSCASGDTSSKSSTTVEAGPPPGDELSRAKRNQGKRGIPGRAGKSGPARSLGELRAEPAKDSGTPRQDEPIEVRTTNRCDMSELACQAALEGNSWLLEPVKTRARPRVVVS